MSEPDPVDPRVHGPLSLLGVAVGILVAAVPYLVRDVAVLWPFLLVPPLVGLVLLAFSGRSRQLGIGLVASALTYPVGLAVVFGLIALYD